MSYFDAALKVTSREDAIKRARTVLVPLLGKIDGFVGRGMSGVCMGNVIAYALGRPFAIVRKDEDIESSHSWMRVEYPRVSAFETIAWRYVIVDDFISSGATVRTIVTEMKEHCPKAQCVGVFVYDSENYNLASARESLKGQDLAHTPVYM